MSSNPAIVIGVSAVDTASAVLDQVDKRVLETSQVIEQEGEKTISKTQQISDAFKENYTQIATGIAGLSAGIIGFSTSFSVLERSQLSADKANLTYQRSLDALNKLQASGTATSEQLAVAQEAVRIAGEKASLQQEHANEVYMNFLANVPLQFMSFATGAVSILHLLGIEQVGTAIKTAAMTAANYLLGTSFGEASASSVVFTGALASVGAAQAENSAETFVLTGALMGMAASEDVATASTFTLAAAFDFLMANPIVLVIAGIVTLVTLLIFNVGGLRDMFYSAGQAVADFMLNDLGPLSELLRSVIAFFGITTDSTKQAAQATNDLGTSVTNTKDKIQTYDEYLQKQSDDTAQATRENLYYIQSHDALASSLVTSGQQIDLVAGYLRSQASEAANTAQANFDLVASHSGLQSALSLTDDELANFADALRESKRLQDDTTKAAQDEADAQAKATQQIADRVNQNHKLFESMGLNVDMSDTTVGETDRIKSHVEDLQRQYDSSRKQLEDFAIAHGVQIPTAVKATDNELVNLVTMLTSSDAKSKETSQNMIDHFRQTQAAVAQYQTGSSEDINKVASTFTSAVDKSASDNERLRQALQATIDKYESLAQAANNAANAVSQPMHYNVNINEGGNTSVSSSNNTGSSSSNSSSSGSSSSGGYSGGLNISGDNSSLSLIGLADGGLLTEPVIGRGLQTGKAYSFAENGPEYFLGTNRGLPSSFTNTPSGNITSKREIHIHVELKGREIAHAIVDDLDELQSDNFKRKLGALTQGLHGLGR